MGICWGGLGLERQSDPLKQAEQVELAVGMHGFQDFLGGEIVDPDDEALAKPAEVLRQPGIGLRRQRLEIGQRGRSHPPPSLWAVELACHASTLGDASGLTKRLTERAKWATVNY